MLNPKIKTVLFPKHNFYLKHEFLDEMQTPAFKYSDHKCLT